MPQIVLIQHPRSPYAQKVRILLREKSLPFTACLAGGGLGSEQSAREMREANPRLEVPVLQYGDARPFDSTIILAFLEETYPEPALLPDSPVARARARMIEEVFDTHWEAVNWGMGELALWDRADESLEPLLKAAAKRDIGHLYQWLAGELRDQEWLSGSRFGWADLCAAPFVATTLRFGLPPDPGSPLAGWLERLLARPSVRDTVAEAAALHYKMPELIAAMKTGAYKRQYRDHRLEWMLRSGGTQIVLDGLANGTIRFTDLQNFAAGIDA